MKKLLFHIKVEQRGEGKTEPLKCLLNGLSAPTQLLKQMAQVESYK